VNVFRSVRFNISLGVLITLACAVGTLLPQLPEVPEKVSQYQAVNPNLFKLFDFFGLFNLYQSWWFMGMLGLMAFDVVLCKLMSRPPDHGLVALPPEMTREEKLEHLAQKDAALKLKPYQASFASALSSEEASTRAKAFLAEKGYEVSHDIAERDGGTFVATRHKLQRWGSYISHIALVVILVGSLLKGLFGFVEMVPVLEGRSRPLQNRPGWELFVDKFTIAYYEGTMSPKLFSSELRVEKDGVEVGKKLIIVNDPLDIGGVRFYQASWGAGGMFRSVTLKIGAKQTVQMAQRTPTKVPGTPFVVEADVLMPNFTITDGRADTESLDLKNPAVKITFTVGPHKTAPLWLLVNQPELAFVEDGEGFLSRAPKPPFSLAKIDPILFSGVQVAYDPGFKVVLIGSIMWLVGMIMLFYLHRRRLWVVVEPAAGGSRVAVGGWSSRGDQEFSREFNQLMDALRRPLQTRDDDDFKITRNPLAEVTQ
jgi:cytochrome c biogenesis protein